MQPHSAEVLLNTPVQPEDRLEMSVNLSNSPDTYI